MTDPEYLESKGWKRIGQKRHSHGLIHCWVPPQDSTAAESPRAWWTQGDAIGWQRMHDRAGVLPDPLPIGRNSV